MDKIVLVDLIGWASSLVLMATLLIALTGQVLYMRQQAAGRKR